jgi:hypothetical protein
MQKMVLKAIDKMLWFFLAVFFNYFGNIQLKSNNQFNLVF